MTKAGWPSRARLFPMICGSRAKTRAPQSVEKQNDACALEPVFLARKNFCRESVEHEMWIKMQHRLVRSSAAPGSALSNRSPRCRARPR